MRVVFTKVDAKRYSIAIEREHGPALVPRPAPGYDDLMPHDLAHYVVEEFFGIELGVSRQLAAGGRHLHPGSRGRLLAVPAPGTTNPCDRAA